MTCSQVPIKLGDNDGSTQQCFYGGIIYYGQEDVNDDLDTSQNYWYRPWYSHYFVCDGKGDGQTFEEASDKATKVDTGSGGGDGDRKCFCKSQFDMKMEDNSPMDASLGWPLKVNLNPRSKLTDSMRLKCTIGSPDSNGQTQFYSNVFTVSFQCQGSSYSAQVAQNELSKTAASGELCYKVLSNIATACTSSVNIYTSQSDQTTPVTHYLPVEGGSDIAQPPWLWFYYSGLGTGHQGKRDQADWTFQIQVTETAENGGGTYWVSDIYRLYCDPCITTGITVPAEYDSFASPFTVIVGLQSGTSNSNPVDIKSETDSVFIGGAIPGTGIGQSSTGCDAIYFYAFSDSGLTIPYSDVDISLNAADTITPEDLVTSFTTQYLTVNTAVPFIKNLYLQGKNTGNFDAYVQQNAVELEVVVCGGSETYSIDDTSPYSIVLQKEGVEGSGASFNIAQATHNSWFVETPGASSRQGCFGEKTYTLCNIEPTLYACGSLWTNSDLIFMNGNQIRVNRQPVQDVQLYFLSYLDLVLISAHRQVIYTVCGLEKIEVTDSSIKLFHEYELGSYQDGISTPFYVLSEEFEPFMVSSDSNCPLYKVDLVYKNSNKEPFDFVQKNRTQLTMETWGTNRDFNLRIETAKPFYWETYYLRGSSQSTEDTLENNGYIELNVQVINCTAEYIEIMNPGTWQEITITQYATTPYRVVINDEENLKFNSSHATFCPITKYEVVDITDNEGNTIVEAFDFIEMGDPLIIDHEDPNYFKLIEIDTNEQRYYKNLLIWNTSALLTDYWIHIQASSGLNATNSSLTAHLNIVQGMNHPPMFVQELKSLKLDLNSANPYLKYSLPDIVDYNNHTFEVAVSDIPKFGKFNSDTKTFMFNQLEDKDIGNYEIAILLVDERLLEVEYILKLEVMNSFVDLGILVEEEVEEIIEVIEEVVVSNNPKVRAQVVAVSSFGVINVTFSESIFRNSTDLSWIDSSVINLELVPFNLLEDMDPDMLSFEWKVVRFEGTRLDLKVNFANPVFISLGQSQDQMIITLNSYYFIAEETSEPLDVEYRVLQTPISKQLVDSQGTKSFVTGTEAIDKFLKWAFWFVLAFNVLMSGSEAMDYFIGLINALQMVIHLPMLWIIMPGNVTLFFQIILPIVMFDVLDGLDDTKYDISNLFQFSDCSQLDKQKYIDQMRDLGYKTSNSILNLGSLFILLMVYFIRVFLLIFFYISAKFFGRGKKIYQKQVNALFYNEILLLMMEGYMEFLIAGYLNYDKPICDDNASGEKIAIVVSYLCLMTTLVIVPGAMIYLLNEKLDIIQSIEFKNSYGSLYEGIKTDSKFKLAFYFVFIIRRMMFSFIAFGLSWNSVYQVQAVYLMNIIIGIYTGFAGAKIQKKHNQLDLFNEFIIQATTLHLVFFTDFIPSPQTQYGLGYSMICFMSALIMGNLLLVIWFGSKSVKFIFIKYYRIIRRFIDPTFMKPRQKIYIKTPKVSVLERHIKQQKAVGLPEIQEVRESQEFDKRKIKPLPQPQMNSDLLRIQNDYLVKSFKDIRKEQVLKSKQEEIKTEEANLSQRVLNPIQLKTNTKTKIASQMPRLGFDVRNIRKVNVPKMNRPWQNIQPKSFQRNTNLANKIERELQQLKKRTADRDDVSGFELSFSDYNLDQ